MCNFSCICLRMFNKTFSWLQDVHDRALFYYRLLQYNISVAERVVNPPKQAVSVFADTQSSEIKDRIFDEFNSLSVVYQKVIITLLPCKWFQIKAALPSPGLGVHVRIDKYKACLNVSIHIYVSNICYTYTDTGILLCLQHTHTHTHTYVMDFVDGGSQIY